MLGASLIFLSSSLGDCWILEQIPSTSFPFGFEGGADIAVDPTNGNIYCLSYYQTNGASPGNICIQGLTKNGDISWSKYFNDGTQNISGSIGYTTVANAFDYLYVGFNKGYVKLDTSGNFITSRAMIDSSNPFSVQRARTYSGDTYIVGNVGSSNNNAKISIVSNLSTTGYNSVKTTSGTDSWYDIVPNSVAWTVTGVINSIPCIAGLDSSVKISWKKAFSEINAYSIASVGSITYAVCNNGIVLKVEPSVGGILWSKQLSTRSGTYAITVNAYNNDIFVYYGSNLIRIDASGNIVWKRSLTHSSYITYSGITMYSDANYVYLNGYAYASGTSIRSVIMKLPIDGSNMGTYGSWTYSEPNVTITNISLTPSSFPTITETFDSAYTVGTSTLNNPSVTNTINKNFVR